MRTHRLISCLLLLQGKKRVTARQLATSLEVSMRTVYRDIDTLCEAGLPIHMERGPQGGIILADQYRRALAKFTDDELQTLFASAEGPMVDIGLSPRSEALQKLAGALPAAQRRAAEKSRERLLLDNVRWSRAEQPRSVLVRLRRAIADDRRVKIKYRDRGGALTERALEPLGLVAKAGIWYLVASEAEKGYRTFRAERILDLTEESERFTRPEGFDLEAHWNASVAAIESRPQRTYDVVLRVKLEAMAEFNPYWESTMVAEEDDGAVVRMAFPSREFAVMQVLAFGDSIEVIEPSDLPLAIAESARVALARYDCAPE